MFQITMLLLLTVSSIVGSDNRFLVGEVSPAAQPAQPDQDDVDDTGEVDEDIIITDDEDSNDDEGVGD